MCLQLHDNRLEQLLRRRCRDTLFRLESFVQNPLVSGVHVHENQSVPILRHDVDPVELGDGHAQRMFRIRLLRLRRPERRRRRRHRLMNGIRQSPRAAQRAVGISRCAPVRECEPRRARRWLRRARAGRTGQVRLRPGQNPLHRAKHELVNLPAVAEADFQFCRVSVHVDQPRIEGQIQDIRRMSAVIQHVPIRQPDGVRQQAIAHAAAVHEPELPILLRARGGRQADPARDLDRPGRMLHNHRFGRKIRAENSREAPLRATRSGDRGSLECRSFAVAKPECHVEARQRQPLDEPHDMTELGRFASNEFAPRGNVEEQVPDLDRRSRRMGGRADPGNTAALDADLAGVLRLTRPGSQPQP